jgi:prepilin-type processing-associated H-X9-DG protein
MAPLSGVSGSLSSHSDSHKRITAVLSGSVLMIEEKLWDASGSKLLTAYPPAGGSAPDRTNELNEYMGANFIHLNFANFLYSDGHIKALKAGTQFDLMTWRENK